MRNRLADGIARVLWVLTMLGAGAAAAEFILTVSIAAEISAPQMAALASKCLVYAIVPYVFARGWDELTRPAPKPVAPIEPKL